MQLPLRQSITSCLLEAFFFFFPGKMCLFIGVNNDKCRSFHELCIMYSQHTLGFSLGHASEDSSLLTIQHLTRDFYLTLTDKPLEKNTV